MRFNSDNRDISIDEALEMISEYEAVQGEEFPTDLDRRNIPGPDSLENQCEKVLGDEEAKPTLRVIHHFACSGGTLISKCISALPNTFLLSEVHPLSVNHLGGKPKYLPSDITTLARYAEFPNIEGLARKLFVSNIVETESFLKERGGKLVLREHTHIDFCVGSKVSTSLTVNECLAQHFDILNVITVRHPVDAYMSLVANNWVQFTPSTFDEYCSRMLSFLDGYSNCKVFKYEDFVANPDEVMRSICRELDLVFDTSYKSTFSSCSVTGDSGRSGDFIEKRQRRATPAEFLEEIRNSQSFKKLSEKLVYSSDF